MNNESRLLSDPVMILNGVPVKAITSGKKLMPQRVSIEPVRVRRCRTSNDERPNSVLMEAEKSARIFETSGKQSLQDYLDELQRQKSVRFYFFDEDGNPLLDRGAPKFILKFAKEREALNRTSKENLSLVVPKQGVAMRLVEGPSGRKYNLTLQQSPMTILPVSQVVGEHPTCVCWSSD